MSSTEKQLVHVLQHIIARFVTSVYFSHSVHVSQMRVMSYRRHVVLCLFLFMTIFTNRAIVIVVQPSFVLCSINFNCRLFVACYFQ